MVPFVGGVIGGAFDVASTKAIANRAMKMFIDEAMMCDEAFAEEDLVPVQAIVLVEGCNELA